MNIAVWLKQHQTPLGLVFFFWLLTTIRISLYIPRLGVPTGMETSHYHRFGRGPNSSHYKLPNQSDQERNQKIKVLNPLAEQPMKKVILQNDDANDINSGENSSASLSTSEEQNPLVDKNKNEVMGFKPSGARGGVRNPELQGREGSHSAQAQDKLRSSVEEHDKEFYPTEVQKIADELHEVQDKGVQAMGSDQVMVYEYSDSYKAQDKGSNSLEVWGNSGGLFKELRKGSAPAEVQEKTGPSEVQTNGSDPEEVQEEAGPLEVQNNGPDVVKIQKSEVTFELQDKESDTVKVENLREPSRKAEETSDHTEMQKDDSEIHDMDSNSPEEQRKPRGPSEVQDKGPNPVEMQKRGNISVLQDKDFNSTGKVLSNLSAYGEDHKEKDQAEINKPSLPKFLIRSNSRDQRLAEIFSKIRFAKKKGPQLSHTIDPLEVLAEPKERELVKEKIHRLNEEQRILNLHQYGPVVANTTILLVQVHRRLLYLRHLVESMRRVHGIGEALVIFSHDFWDEDINAFVQNISEFRVLQMFFPHSIQLHPDSFPGRDPRDCAWNHSRNSHEDCLNKAWPDKYGHYREPQFTQIKHHWWWKINRVFEGLNVTREWSGVVLNLEEDHYLLADTLHVLKLMLSQRAAVCPSCHVMALGNYNLANSVVANIMAMGDWPVSKFNMGYTLDRQAWTQISASGEAFCSHDDYNWDLTLASLVLNNIRPRLGMMQLMLSRVAHLGTCGTHFKAAKCDIPAEIKKVMSRIDPKALFPSTLITASKYIPQKMKKLNVSGGWGDLRDRQLCRKLAAMASHSNTSLGTPSPRELKLHESFSSLNTSNAHSHVISSKGQLLAEEQST